MNKIDQIKQVIIDLLRIEDNEPFCVRWLLNQLNRIRRRDGMYPLNEFIVHNILNSMIDDGTIDIVGIDSYILVTPEDDDEEEEEEEEVVSLDGENAVDEQCNISDRSINITYNIIINL